MEAPLHAVERACRRKAGRLKEILLIDPNDLQTQPVWYLLPTIDDLDFKSGKAPFLFQSDHLTARLTDTTDVSTKHGDFFTYTLNATVRNQRLDIEYLRAKLMHRTVHVAATDHGGYQRFLPHMRLTAKADTGSRILDRNEYQFTGTCRLYKPAPALNATLTAIGGSSGGSTGGGTTPPGSSGGVAPVVITTSASSYTYTVPAGKLLVGISVKGTDNQTVWAGTSAGGFELGGPIDVLAGEWQTFGAAMRRFNSSTPIYLSGLTGTNTIEVWLLG